MIVEEFDGKTDRILLSHLITNKEFLGCVLTTFTHHDYLFHSPECNLLASLAVKYFKKHKQALGRNIESAFAHWAESHPNQTTLIDLTSQLLTQLEDQPKQVAVAHLLDLAGDTFNRNRLRRLKDKLEGALEAGDVTEAQRLIETHNKVQLGKTTWSNILTSQSEIESAFTTTANQPLFSYTGDLGLFFSNILERECFVAFQGGEKTGKTFILLDVVYRSLQARRKVCLFGCGDMTKQQYQQRIYSRIAFHPFRTQTNEWPYTIRVPSSIEVIPKKKDGTVPVPKVEYRYLEYSGPITAEIALKKCNQFHSRIIKSSEDYLKIVCHPTFTVSALEIENEIQELIRQDWIPDVVVIDYADILAPIDTRLEHRHQINQTWMTLRRIAAEFHLLLVTATQADADSYERRTQTRRNFSDDKRKHAHVTAMIGNNQTAAEKKAGLRRFNILDKRDGQANELDCVVVGGCLDVSSPCIVSQFENQK